jgi:hypothetical protein
MLVREYSIFENRKFQFVKSSIAIFVKTKTEERIQKTLFSSSPAQLKRIKQALFRNVAMKHSDSPKITAKVELVSGLQVEKTHLV